MSNARRTLEISQPWPDSDQPPASLSDCVRYLRTFVAQGHPHTEYAKQRCTDAAAVMAIRHPEYFT